MTAPMISLRPAPLVRPLLNIGALFDVPTGHYTRGARGESILNGGLGMLTGMAGLGNSFKTTIVRYQSMTANARYNWGMNQTYDTEINTHIERLNRLQDRVYDRKGRDLLADGKWIITDKVEYLGDEWFDIQKEYMQNRRKKSTATDFATTPFRDREPGKFVTVLRPTGVEIDSLSEFITADVVRMQDENSLGDSGANTMSMRQGLQKSRMLAELPALAGGSNTYFLMTAHLGTEFNLDPRAPAPKKLHYLKQGVKLKGVPEKFTFLMNNCWLAYGTSPMFSGNSAADRTVEYPRDADDDRVGDTDLNLVTLTQLRGKSGPTGITLQLVVSQDQGVLASLTEFHYIKNSERFGLEGNVQNYALALYPECKLQRTRVRGKIDSDAKLRRALNITSELRQIHDFWHDYRKDLLCTPKELYDDLKTLGYDWELILSKTRGWWSFEGDHADEYFLSTQDLLMMRVGEYIPYWMESPPEKALELYKSKAGKDWTPGGAK